MYKLLISLLPIIVLVGLWFMLYSAIKPTISTLDCSVAEISVDTPANVKEECRKKKSGRI